MQVFHCRSFRYLLKKLSPCKFVWSRKNSSICESFYALQAFDGTANYVSTGKEAVVSWSSRLSGHQKLMYNAQSFKLWCLVLNHSMLKHNKGTFNSQSFAPLKQPGCNTKHIPASVVGPMSVTRLKAQALDALGVDDHYVTWLPVELWRNSSGLLQQTTYRDIFYVCMYICLYWEY